LKKYATLGIGLLSVVTALALMAAPADARAHRHHRHHRHGGGGGGGGITCGPGTVNSGGTCVPVPTGPTGNGNVNITPNNVTMNLDGTFASSVVVSGLPPLTPVTTNTGITCGTSTITVTLNTANTDALGRIGATIANGTPSCVAGTYPLTFTETTSPFQTFTGFLTLHF